MHTLLKQGKTFKPSQKVGEHSVSKTQHGRAHTFPLALSTLTQLLLGELGSIKMNVSVVNKVASLQAKANYF